MQKEELHRKASEKKDEQIYVLILLNDDVNTFDHVIKSLVEVCGHEDWQAEQCAMITHFKGSCDIRRGNFYLLSSMSDDLAARGLRSKVENQ